MTKRILLVDDEPSIRESLSKILRAENYAVVAAENGQDAIEKHTAGSVDLLILDLNLSAKDGWDTFKRMTEISPRLPTVIITGRSNQRSLAENAGVDVLMEKPLNVPLLLQTIRELLIEPMEKRATRVSHSASSFRYVPCDDQLFREMQLKRFTTPLAVSQESKDA